MSFLDRFPEAERKLFEAAATPVQVPRGACLLRRGEPGGDVFIIRKGTFEVVDTRSHPEVILTILEEGAVTGEMSFVDDSPRSADVRAMTDAEALMWSRDDLRELLAKTPGVAAVFYEQLAKIAAARVRNLTSQASAGPRADSHGGSAARVKADAMRAAGIAKESLLDLDTRLRQDPGDLTVTGRVRAALDQLQADIQHIYASHTDPEEQQLASRHLSRELHPYLVRSSLAERCIRRPEGVGGAADILAHVLVDRAGGDGQLGEIIDRWLLDRPMLAAMRRFREPVLERVRLSLPKHRNRRILVLNAGTGSLVASLSHIAGRAPTVVSVMDQSRESLAYLDAGITRPKAVDFRTIQENLAAFAMGRARVQLQHQDVIVLQNLVEYMPERIAGSLLSVCRSLLAGDGSLVVCTMAASEDQDLFDALLNWPTVPRSREGVRRMFASAGLVAEEVEVHHPAMLFVGKAG